MSKVQVQNLATRRNRNHLRVGHNTGGATDGISKHIYT